MFDCLRCSNIGYDLDLIEQQNKRMVELITNQGKIKGRTLSLRGQLADKKVWQFQNIPFAKIERFEKPQPYG